MLVTAAVSSAEGGDRAIELLDVVQASRLEREAVGSISRQIDSGEWLCGGVEEVSQRRGLRMVSAAPAPPPPLPPPRPLELPVVL